MTFRQLMTGLFVLAIAVAGLGGLLMVAVQAVGLVAGQAILVDALNGGFKTMLCVAASVASIAVYLTLYTRDPNAAGSAKQSEG